MSERSLAFPCFGSTCALHICTRDERDAQAALARGRATLLGWHERFSRFLPGSELTRLNEDPREEIEVSPLVARLVRAVRHAAERSEGLVDGTLLQAIEGQGYTDDLAAGVPLEHALALAPPRTPAGPSAAERWRLFEVDERHGTVRRPPGVRLDGGGLAKGLFADVLASTLREHDSFVVDCAGDLALGGPGAVERPVRVESPFDGSIVHTFGLRRGGVATSGIGRRSWIGADGRPRHHLLDPATGTPAFTGIVQVTALAPSALEAEIRAKAALLSGPRGARRWLTGGGVVIDEDGTAVVIDACDARELTDVPQVIGA